MPPNQQLPNQQIPNQQFPNQQVETSSVDLSQKIHETPKNPNSTQNTLLLSEVRENMVIMTDGTFRAVVACQPINFDLMSQSEQEAVEYGYQNFLNSLTHPIQIIARSQRVDIGPYLDKLINIRNSNDNMLLNLLMDDYINFVDILAQDANIMDKSFFIIIPYFPLGELNTPLDQSKGFFNILFSKAPPSVVKIDSKTYERAKTDLANRVNSIVNGLSNVGIKSVPLNTKELGELYYNFYNPDTALREPLGNFNEAASTYVRKEVINNPSETTPSTNQTEGGING